MLANASIQDISRPLGRSTRAAISNVLARADAETIDPARGRGRENQPRATRRDWIAGVHCARETRVIVTLERVRR